MTVINGKNEANELNVSRYAEIIGSHDKATDVTNGRTIPKDSISKLFYFGNKKSAIHFHAKTPI